MTQKRNRASSVLDINGDMWIIGGTANSTASDSTEIYNYKPAKGWGGQRVACDQVCQREQPDNPACCQLIKDIQAKEAGRWRKGFPLPQALRDTGLQDTCAIKINKTHVFLAGGYARNYEVSDVVNNNLVEGIVSDK